MPSRSYYQKRPCKRPSSSSSSSPALSKRNRLTLPSSYGAASHPHHESAASSELSSGASVSPLQYRSQYVTTAPTTAPRAGLLDGVRNDELGEAAVGYGRYVNDGRVAGVGYTFAGPDTPTPGATKRGSVTRGGSAAQVPATQVPATQVPATQVPPAARRGSAAPAYPLAGRASQTDSATVRRSLTAGRGSLAPALAPAPAPAPGLSQLDAFDEDDSLNEVVLALDVKGRRQTGSSALGACWYVAREERLFFLEDVRGGGIEGVEAVKQQARPTHILLPSRVDEAVDEMLDPRNAVNGGQRDGEQDDTSLNLPYQLDIRPSSEFAYDAALQRLVDIELPRSRGNLAQLAVPGEDPGDSSTGFTDRPGSLLRLSAAIDFESRLSVGCVGAVLAYLSRRRALLYTDAPGNERTLAVSSVETIALEGHMLLNSDTISALQVAHTESHPSLQNRGPSNSGAKEDLSLYGIFKHLAKTPQGKTLLRQWFVRPSTDLGIITERQATLAAFLQPLNQSLMDDIVKSLKSIKNMRIAVVHLRKGMSSSGPNAGIKNGVWYSLRSFAFHTLGIRAACSQLSTSQGSSVVRKVLSLFNPHQLATLGRLVTEVVDFPTSSEQRRTAVRPRVDAELDELRRTYDGLDSLLSDAGSRIADTVPQSLGVEVKVVYFPQIGFLVQVPRDQRTGRSAYEGNPSEEWELVFSTPESAYYKDYRVRQLDGTVGDVWAKVCGKEIEIVHALAQKVLLLEELLVRVSDVCGELDALLALAQGARLYNLVRPEMTERNVVEIRGGRHLLMELANGAHAFIPNDTLLEGGKEGFYSRQSCTDGDRIEGCYDGHDQCNEQEAFNNAHVSDVNAFEDTRTMPPPPLPSDYCSKHSPPPTQFPSLLVLTGPNYSGKSVYIKQVATIVLLAHIGSNVPCLSATVGLTDSILTRVASGESVSRPHSAFALDLRQVASALQLATRRSLVLLDELGKGTLPTDGAAICAGVLKYLARGDEHERPKVLAATHFSEICEGGFLREEVEMGRVAWGRMDVRIEMEGGRDVIGGGKSGRHRVPVYEDPGEQVTYLYALTEGYSKQSLATACAALNGVDKAVVARAEELIRLQEKAGDLVAAVCGGREGHGGNGAMEEGESSDEDMERVEGIARTFLAGDLMREVNIEADDRRWRTWLETLV